MDYEETEKLMRKICGDNSVNEVFNEINSKNLKEYLEKTDCFRNFGGLEKKNKIN